MKLSITLAGPLAAAALAAGLLAAAGAGRARAATVLVKTLGDSGPGSLRAAMTLANARPNTTIAFAVPRSLLRGGVATIRPLKPLPTVRAEGTRIDGTSQARFVGDTNPRGPEVALDGSRLPGGLFGGRLSGGLVIEAARCRLSGLCVHSFGGAGVLIRGAGATQNRVAGCFIGTDAAGRTAAPNGIGLALRDGAHHNVIGGTTASARNVISGNGVLGIAFSNASSNQVQGCFVGVDASGLAALPNGVNGIEVARASAENAFGGAEPGARCVISGNGGAGILLVGAGASRNTVRGCFVGLDASGKRALGNASAGIGLAGGVENLIGGARAGEGNVSSGNDVGVNITGASRNNTVHGNLLGTDATGEDAVPNRVGAWVREASSGNRIGGSVPGARNVVSGNAEAGLWIGQAGTVGNVVQGNIVGLSASGTRALPNGQHGVGLYEGARENVVGGAGPGEGNAIAGNKDHGVSLLDAATTSNRVQGNLIGLAPGGARFPNGGHGVGIFKGARGNVIGGSAPGQGNTIAYSRLAFFTEGGDNASNALEGNVIDPLIAGGWSPGQSTAAFAPREWNVSPFVKGAGEYIVRFQYSAGADRLDIEWAELLENGRAVARDAHAGRTGLENSANEYRLPLPALTPGATYTVRASVAGPSGSDSWGEVQLRRVAPASAPAPAPATQ